MSQEANKPTTFNGSLRPRIHFLGEKEVETIDHRCGVPTKSMMNIFKIEWIEGNDVSKVVWTETITCFKDHSFVPQVSLTGTFQLSNPFFVDEDNLRHFRMTAEPGKFHSVFSNPSCSKD